MRISILFCISCLLLTQCNNSKKKISRENFRSFDFTYNDVFSTCFSIKFSQSDTVFIRQHFASHHFDSLRSNTSYYACLSETDRSTFDSFINVLPFSSFDTAYYQNSEDGTDYQFYIDKDTTEKLIRVHSDSVPSSLANFANWIVQKKTKLVLHQLDTAVYFHSEKFVVPPPAPPLAIVKSDG